MVPLAACHRSRTNEVHPDSSVHVKAPKEVGFEDVRAKVLKRAGWITKQQRTFESYPPPLPTRQYTSGESFRYLGKQYRLKVIEADTERVKLYRGRLEVAVHHPGERAAVKKLVDRWYKARAEHVFTERYEACLEKVRSCGISHNAGFDLYNMSKRWGSCTKDGRILLNPLLVGAPKECIDYVVIHELCHTVERNHSTQFYSLLSRCLSDWQNRRDKLNTRLC